MNTEGEIHKKIGPCETRTGSIKPDWTRINRPESIENQPNWTTQQRAEEWAMRDLEKPIQQLLADIYQAHQQRYEDLSQPRQNERDPVLLILYTLARTSGMMANVSLSNEKVSTRLLLLTYVVAVLTAILTALTIILTVKAF